MFKNYFKTLVRNLWKNRGYSFLNIFGLSMGIACAALIFLWVEDEVNFNHNHAKKDRIYYVKVNQEFDKYVATFSSTPGLLGPAMQADFPGVVRNCRYTETPSSLLFSIGDRSMYATGHYTEKALFSMFTLPFEQGNADNAFASVHSLVITHATAVKLFGNDQQVVGKTVRVDNKQDYVVSGVLKDIPENSSLQFEWLAPYEVWSALNTYSTNWGSFCLSTFIELKPDADPESINQRLKTYLQQKVDQQSNAHPFLFSMNKWNLYDEFDNGQPTGSGRVQYVRLFSVIAWIILFIACINFMNLATARSEQRSREVGVRKVLGAGKKTLVIQFIGEALLMAMLAAGFSLILVSLSLPAFDMLVRKQLTIGLNIPAHLIALLTVTLVCGLVAGSYPSLYLSSFNPVAVLKGMRLKTGNATLIRKGLVVVQFTVSIILIIATMIIYRQIEHVKSRNLGMNKDNIIYMRLQGQMLNNYAAIRQDLLGTGQVENTALADYPIIYGGNNTWGIKWSGKKTDSRILISQRTVSGEFLSLNKMHLIEGRDFEPTDTLSLDANQQPIIPSQCNVIITESLQKLMGKGSAVGKLLQQQQDDTHSLDMKVVGVVKDYLYGNMYGTPDPVVFYCSPPLTSFLYVRVKALPQPEQVLTAIEGVLKKDNPGYPFEYTFLDDQFNQLFSSEMLVSRLSRVFAGLAILISCLGLFGLSAYTAERRTKEIGIRKVLGASVAGIAQLLSKDFLQLVYIACLVAFPAAWWIMHSWLQNYEYRINIDIWVFLIAAIAAMLIAVLTVSFQAVKAAVANPMTNLRTE